MKAKETQCIHVRVPIELSAWLREMAKQNHRSINNEIVFSLENEKARRALTQRALDELTPTSN